ncbi:MAG: GPR endopeptidase [Bacilli bacterium]|nr:GPR endopeptidase [Bacilli bacterium]
MENKEYNYRTDIAYDEIAKFNDDLLGIKTTIKNYGDIKVVKTKINKKHDKRIQKKSGLYYTIEFQDLNIHNNDSAEKIIQVLAKVLVELLKTKKVLDKKGMLIGLGNINVTPDSIGPYTLDNVIVTRHLFVNDQNNIGYSNVSGYSPGVMGNTGIETADIINAIYSKVGADFLIVVDALATSSVSRINKTIQITDSGISPGSGVGNKRKEISKETMGIPVIAVGIPTVVDAKTLTIDLINKANEYLNGFDNSESKIRDINTDELRNILDVATRDSLYDMVVTPKEIDEVVEDISKILAAGIDIAIHKKLRETYLKA